jgi:hypothetical protein
MASEPITREEVFLNSVATGEATNIEPITREEMFLAKLGGADVTTPTPITRKERFLQKAIASGGGGGSGGGGSTDEGWIGDGNTHIWITLHEGRTSPMLGVCPNGTVTVDWGDGTTPDVLTGTSTSAVKYTPTHDYAEPGDYVITLSADGEMGFYGDSSDYAAILVHSSRADMKNRLYQTAIQKAEIGNGVTSIGNYAFSYCQSLTSVVIPNSVTSIGIYAFIYCYSLASVVIPNSVTSIGNNAFYNCYSLASAVIQDGVTSIDYNAFYNCYSLASVVIPNSVTSIGYSAFSSCYSLARVVIQDGVTSIDYSAFSDCYSLASVVIQDGVTSISNNIFKNCRSLASVVIPNSVTSIGNNAFGFCYGVRFYDFTNHTAVPTLANTNAFSSISSDCEIRVPAALYDEWIAATNWTTYASQIVAV